MKNDVMKVTLELINEAKKVQKDLNKIYTEWSSNKKLESYKDITEFKSKTLDKLLASSKNFELQSLKMSAALQNILGSGLYPGMSTPGAKVTVDSIKNFNHYLNAFKIALVK